MRLIANTLGVLVLLFGLAGPALAADLEVSVAGLKDGVVQPHAQLGPVIIVTLATNGFQMKDFTKSTAVNDREGHVHIWLDNQTFNTLTSEPAWVFGGVAPGKHTLNVELVRNNHTPLSPPVKKTITFTMTK
jgi:hypothetical protein